MSIVRVAAAQMAAGTVESANLATCLRLVEAARNEGAELVVLPEFCNHLSWYEGPEHAFAVAVEKDGAFLAAIAAKARELAVHVVVNATVRRGPGRITATSFLFDDGGKLLAEADKQVLMGHENDFLVRGTENGPVVQTRLGRIGLYACMDGVIAETPRGLAVRGAQILCNSLNSFALDEASLHVPVRAAENRVFVVAANKVGPLIPEPLIAPVSAATNIPAEFLEGAGESQIVAPDGRVLAKAPRRGEAVVIADIEVDKADDKQRPDGTDVFGARRPDLYAPIAAPPTSHAPLEGDGAADAVRVAVVQPVREGTAAIAHGALAVLTAAKGGAKLVVLPELFCFEGGLVDVTITEAEGRSHAALEAVAVACVQAKRETGDDVLVATSLVLREGAVVRHAGVLVGPGGVRHVQPQIHASARHARWAKPGGALGVYTAPWGRIGIVVGDDAVYPETFRVLALQGAEVVAVPTHVLEPWESELGLLERSAENRVCLAAATRPSSAGTSLVADLWGDFTIMTPWKERAFDGTISAPLVTRATMSATVTFAAVHPRYAANKTVSRRTHLLDDRPWRLAGPLVASP